MLNANVSIFPIFLSYQGRGDKYVNIYICVDGIDGKEYYPVSMDEFNNPGWTFWSSKFTISLLA